jgi:hypothetical protein
VIIQNYPKLQTNLPEASLVYLTLLEFSSAYMQENHHANLVKYSMKFYKNILIISPLPDQRTSDGRDGSQTTYAHWRMEKFDLWEWAARHRVNFILFAAMLFSLKYISESM